MTHHKEIIKFEVGGEIVKNGIAKFINSQENSPQEKLTAQESMELYTCVYNMCTQKPPHLYDQQLYDLYRQIIEEYVEGTVLSSLREKHDEFLLSELVKRWKNHKLILGWMSSQLFSYLDRYYISRRKLPSVEKVGFTCFYDAVSQDINMKARDIVISLIEEKREGAQVDRVLLQNVMDYFVEVGAKGDYYLKHFEEVGLNSTASYYLDTRIS